MDTNALIADWQRRLITLSQKPRHVFRDTPQDLIDAYHQRQTTFIGFSESELDDAELSFGVQFTGLFRTYLILQRFTENVKKIREA